MSPHPRPSFLVFFAFLLLLGCSSKEEPDSRKGDTNSQNVFETDIEEHDGDIQDEVEDINDDLNPGLEYVQFKPLEGMIEFSWALPEENIISEIRITATPAELMWGEALRIVDPTVTSYLFDKLVNDINYTFEIQAFSGDEEVGEPFIRDATPFTRPLLAIGKFGNPPLDSLTRQPAPGWETYIEHKAVAFRWSPDGTKLFTYLSDSNRCALFDRATREEIQLEPSDEMDRLCLPQDLSWSPDGRYVAFIHILEGLPNTTRVSYSVLDTQTGEIESDWPDPLELDLNYVHINTLDWSPDGERLALGLQEGSNGRLARLLMINTQTKEFDPDWITVPDGRITDSFELLRWSPDSKRLAVSYFSSSYTPPLYPYFILNAETKEVETDWPELIRPTLSVPTQFVWSPDGDILTLVLFNGSSLGGDSIQAISTSTRENIPGWPSDWPGIQYVDWSHNSQFLAISSRTSPYLVVLDRASQKPDSDWTPFTEPAGRVSWSPQHDPPTAPTDLALNRTDTSATLSWNPPTDASILDYRVTIEPQDQVDGPADYLLFDPTATEHLIQGLNPELEYNISIHAISVFGVGEPATLSAF